MPSPAPRCDEGWVTETAEGLRLALRVTPRSRRPGVGGLAPGRDGRPRLRVAVTAPPADGAANAAVLDSLARALGLPKSALRVVAGAADRDKAVMIAAGGLAAFRERLDALAGPGMGD